MLTPGEFVIRKSSVKKLGAENLARVNKYAGGGPKIKDLINSSGIDLNQNFDADKNETTQDSYIARPIERVPLTLNGKPISYQQIRNKAVEATQELNKSENIKNAYKELERASSESSEELGNSKERKKIALNSLVMIKKLLTHIILELLD
jgi:hypothetical protein